MSISSLVFALSCVSIAHIAYGHPLSSSSTQQQNFWTGFRGQEHITKLDTSNFDSALETQDAFVMFFKKYCPGSKAARADFATFAKQLNEDGNPTVVGAVDCIESPTVCSRFPKIQQNFRKATPTFIYFKKGQRETYIYEEGHTTRQFYTWITTLQRSFSEFEDEYPEVA